MHNDILLDACENIQLRTLTEGDVTESYVGWLNDYEIMKYTEQKYVEHSILSAKAFVRQKYSSEIELLFGIFLSEEHIGNLKLGPIAWKHKSAELSYFIGEKKYWGRGIASHCVRRVVAYGTEVLQLEKINAGYYETNIGSQKVFEKCGFHVEGVRCSNVVFEGKRLNSIMVGYVP